MESIAFLKFKKNIGAFLYRIIHIPHTLWFKDIGSYTSIDKNVVCVSGFDHVIIGKRCKIYAGLRMEAITSYSFETFFPSIKIGDDVVIGQNFHCTCAESILIGSGTSITANCGVFDIIHPYENIEENPRFAKIKTSPITIGEESLIGMNSVIMPGVHLGKHTIVGANSVVTSGVYPDYSVIAGAPAKVIKTYNFSSEKWEFNN